MSVDHRSTYDEVVADFAARPLPPKPNLPPGMAEAFAVWEPHRSPAEPDEPDAED